MPFSGLKRPAISKTMRQSKQRYQITINIYIQKSMSFQKNYTKTNEY